jgi:hypothetical protein
MCKYSSIVVPCADTAACCIRYIWQQVVNKIRSTILYFVPMQHDASTVHVHVYLYMYSLILLYIPLNIWRTFHPCTVDVHVLYKSYSRKFLHIS